MHEQEQRERGMVSFIQSRCSMQLIRQKGDHMDYRNMTAPCGLDCFNSPMYMASMNEGLRKKIAVKLKIPKEVAQCRGCRKEGGIMAFMKMKESCTVYRCIEENGIDLCADCSDFSCDHPHPYADKASAVPHNTKVFNLCLIKKMGLEAWAAEKAKSVKDTYFKGKFKL